MSLLSSRTIDRRQLLSGAGALSLAVVAPAPAFASSRLFVTSETGRLRKVLVNPATVADHAQCILAGHGTHDADPFWHDAVGDIVDQHADLMVQLKASGTRILQLEDVLDGAIAAARRAGAWTGWLSATYPELAGSGNVRAATLLARDARGASVHAACGQEMNGLSHVRDFAMMLPAGLLLCNVADPTRARQQALFRFMVAYAPEFRGYPVIFDAVAAGFRAEGGDFQVLDQRTLLVGVGNHTDARLAAVLARETGMDVVAVNIRNADTRRWKLDHDPLRDFFLHLNTSVAQIAPDHMLALPWLFEAAHTGRLPDPLVADFGTIARYRARSGDVDTATRGMKLVDHLRDRGFTVSPIGAPADGDLERWLGEIADSRAIFPARERQAANMLALAPANLVAFPGADQTHVVLRGEGAKICTVAGGEVWRGYSGPNCLALPLERA